MAETPIKTQSDLVWHLGFSRRLEPELPIDVEIDRLHEQGRFNGGTSGKLKARRAVFGAFFESSREISNEAKKQEGRKAAPNYLRPLVQKTDRILELYGDVHAALMGNDTLVTLWHIEDSLSHSVPPEKLSEAVAEFEHRFREFVSFEETLHEFRDILQFADALIKPRRGRPPEQTYHFVSALGREWMKMTGRPPTRIYDAINDCETGDFYHFCVASAATVKQVAKIGSLDSAVRRVCEAWAVKATRDPFGMDEIPD